MRTLRLIFAVLAASAVAGLAAAQERLTYSYAELVYISSDYNDFTSDGLGINASYGIGSYLHAFARYSDLDGKFGPFDSNREWLEVGAGINWPQDDKTDLIGRISYVSVDQDVAAPALGGTDVDGIGFEAAVRSRRTEQLELNAGLQYIRFDGGADDFLIKLGARYNFDRRWAGVFDLDYTDGNPTVAFGARYDFR